MSDLQCPATVLLFAREFVVAHACWPFVAGRRVAGIFVDAPSAGDPRVSAAVRGLAESCNCSIEHLPPISDPASLRLEVDQLADAYRGETFVVVAAGDLIQKEAGRMERPIEPIAVSIDSDGWVVAPSRIGA